MAQDLIAALAKAMKAVPKGGNGMTRKDIQKQLGLNEGAALKLINKLNDAGRLEATKVTRTAVDGRLAVVSAYRLKA